MIGRGCSLAAGRPSARVTEAMKVLVLGSEIQARWLLGNLVITERAFRRVLGEAEWDAQRAWRRVDGSAGLEVHVPAFRAASWTPLPGAVLFGPSLGCPV